MTNGEVIRNMDDEDLARFIGAVAYNCSGRGACIGCQEDWCNEDGDLLQWLAAEVEGD